MIWSQDYLIINIPGTPTQIILPHLYTRFNHVMQFNIFSTVTIIFCYWKLAVSFTRWYKVMSLIIFSIFFVIISVRRLPKVKLFFFLCDLKKCNLKLSKMINNYHCSFHQKFLKWQPVVSI